MFNSRSKSRKLRLTMLLVFAIVLQAIFPILAHAKDIISAAEYRDTSPTSKEVTVQGYIIGSKDNLTTNLILGSSPTDNPNEWIPVQLPAKPAELREKYNPVKNKDILGTLVNVTGISNKYYSKTGIQKVTSIEIVEATEPTLPSNPTDPVNPSLPENVSTISQVRASAQSSNVTFSGTVISASNIGGGNSFYVEDETAAIYVYPGKDNNLDVKLGDKVVITGTLSQYNGQLQVINVTQASKIDTATPPQALIKNIADLTKDEEAKLVKINNLVVNHMSTDNYANTSFKVTDENDRVLSVRIDSRVGISYDQISKIISNKDKVNISGILSTYNGSYQLLPFSLDHIEIVEKNSSDISTSDETLKIGQIQGKSHVSPYINENVFVEDVVVTYVSGANNYYVQDINPDKDPMTSDGISVYHRDHGYTVGDKIKLRAKVTEYLGNGYKDTKALTDLTITQLVVATGEKVGTTELPIPIELKDSTIPKDNIKTDSIDNYDPNSNSLDYWESVEGMLVSIKDAKIVGPQIYGNIYVLPSDTSEQLNSLGGYNLKPNQNPNVIGILTNDKKLIAKAGDSIPGSLAGPVTYAFSSYKIDASKTDIDIKQGQSEPEITDIKFEEDKVTIASYNVENFTAAKSTSNAKVDRIAKSIVNDLGQPDIITVLEMQDNDGKLDSGETSADLSAKRLIKNIVAKGGVEYKYVDIAPENNKDGGAPGSNIRVGFLYNPNRVTLNKVEAIGKDLPIFQNTRKSLAGYFTFKGQDLLVVGNHLNSKRGDNPLFGKVQPVKFKSAIKRVELAKIVNSYISDQMSANPNLNVVANGDMNDFEFTDTINTLEGGILTDLVKSHDINDRYSYFYQGNSQTLDHMLISNNLLDNYKFDMIHINSLYMEQHGRASDHDPVMVQLKLTKEENPSLVTKERTEKVSIPFETEKIENDNLYLGVENIKNPGQDGEKTLTYKETYKDGKLLETTLVSEEITKEPTKQVLEYGSKALPENKVINKDLPFEIVEEKDDTLAVGKTKIKQEGINGTREIVTGYKVENNKLVEYTLSDKIIKKPVNRIILVGTFVKPLDTKVNRWPVGSVYVRPEKESTKSLGILDLNEKVEGFVDGSWLRINYKGQTAYVANFMLRDHEVQVGYLITQIAVRDINDTTKQVGTINLGTKVVDVSQDGKGPWMEIDFNGRKAQIARYFVGVKIRFTDCVYIRDEAANDGKVIGYTRENDTAYALINEYWTEYRYNNNPTIHAYSATRYTEIID